MADKNRPKPRSGSSTSNTGGLARNNDDIHYDVQKYLEQFWPYQIDKIEKMSTAEFRDPKISQELPLARIKKIMKLDEDVKTQMISAEAPVLFAKACEMFIEELTIRAWVHTEDNKRKTLQKNDIAMAISKHDQFDFLIDIVPREEITKSGGGGNGASGSSPAAKRSGPSPGSTPVESQVPMFLQVATPGPSGIVAQPAVQTIQLQNGQIVQAQTLGGGQAVQLVQGANGELQLVSLGNNTQSVAAQVLHTTPISQHQQQHHQQEASSSQSSSAPFAQAFQQIVAPDGTVHHLPIQLSPAQMNYLKQHLSSGGSQQQVHIIQNSAAQTVTSQPVTLRAQVQQQHQQQPTFFLQTGPIGQGQQQQTGVQLQMITTDHQSTEGASTSST